MKKTSRIILFIAILILVYAAFILVLSFPLITGKTLVLETEPVDPFDIFRGQNLQIGYPISHLDNTTYTDKDIGKNAYVLLDVGTDGIARKIGFSSELPEGTFIKGKIVRNWRGLMLEFGIENYFFERGAEFSTSNMTVEVKVSSGGSARISKLLNNGKPLEINYTR